MKKRKLLRTLILVGLISFMQSDIKVFAKTCEVVTLGNNLSLEERKELFKAFEVKPKDVKVLEMNINDIREGLGLSNIVGNIKEKTYASTLLKVEKEGYGIGIKINNLKEVSKAMLGNALLTAGIKDVNIYATATLPVSGVSALGEITKSFEEATGDVIPRERKEAAREELLVTRDLSKVKNGGGKEIGKDGASFLVNKIKEKVIENKPKCDEDISKISNDIINEYDVEFSKEEEEKLISLLSNINALNLDYGSLKEEFSINSNNIYKYLNESGEGLNKSGFFNKNINRLLDLYTRGKNWLLLSLGREKVEIRGVSYGRDGNIISDYKDSMLKDAEGEGEEATEKTTSKVEVAKKEINKEESSNKKVIENNREEDNTALKDEGKSEKKSSKDSKAKVKEKENNNKKPSKEDNNENKEKVDSKKAGEEIKKEDKREEKKEDIEKKEENSSKKEEDINKKEDREVSKEEEEKAPDYIMVDGKKVPLHDKEGKEYNPETGRYGDLGED